MPYPRRRTDFIRDVAADRQLTPEESYQMLQKFLPAPPPRSATRAPAAKSGANKTSKSDETASDIDNLFIGRRRSRTGARRFVLGQIHILLYTIIHTVFSLYMRIRQAYHEVRNQIYSVLKYHHRTPEIIARDVRDLSRIPKHLSVILRLEEHGREGAELERLINEISDIAAWCASAGIPTLSVYEKRGVLKSYLPETHRAVSTRLASYFGRAHPAVTLQAPHVPAIHSAAFPRAREYGDISEGHIKILLLSEEDGRDSLVDLTKTLADMAQRTKISASDVSIDLIDAELTESIMTDPDLLILFGPYVELFGYPPWQIRLTEIFHVPDNHSVGYQVFLWGLQNYAKAEMRVGR